MKVQVRLQGFLQPFKVSRNDADEVTKKEECVEMSVLTANGVEFFYEIGGDADETLVCVGGYMGDHTGADNLRAHLRNDYRILVFDNQGAGQTKDNGGTLSTRIMAENIMALLNALKIQRPHLFGTSMGGTIVQEMAIDYPEELGKIILASTTMKWSALALELVRLAMDLKRCGADLDAAVTYFACLCHSSQFLAEEQNRAMIKKRLASIEHPQSLTDLKRQYQVLKEFDSQGRVQAISSPCLVLGATHDIVVPSEDIQSLAEAIPEAELAMLDSGHSTILEVPEKMCHEVRSFLKK